MNRTQLESTFDQQAGTYDQQWAKLAAFRDGIGLLMASIFGQLPHHSRMLCVGAGTGAEIHFLAQRFPAWTFVAVEPSAGMVAAAQLRAEQHGYIDRCRPASRLTARHRCLSPSSCSIRASARSSSKASRPGSNRVASW
jgi:tRNA (cmo5U34)-methyltransferase